MTLEKTPVLEYRMAQLEGLVKGEAEANREFRQFVRERLELMDDRFHELDKQVEINRTKAGMVSGGVGFLASLPMSLAALIRSLGAS
jgi:hypothetical protein